MNQSLDPDAVDMGLWKHVPHEDILLCKTLSTHSFLRPHHSDPADQSVSNCPTQIEWLSKTRQNTGWVKLNFNDALPTLTMHPAPNDGATLLLDFFVGSDVEYKDRNSHHQRDGNDCRLSS